MPRKSSVRKDRFWFTVAGGIRNPVVGCNNFNLCLVDETLGTLVQSGAGDILSILRGDRAPMTHVAAATSTVYAAREFTIGAAHMYGNLYDAGALETSGLTIGAVGLGIQGGGSSSVSGLPGLLDNSNTGIWPLVVPIEVMGAGSAAGTTDRFAVYSVNGGTRAQRKVKFGQSIYGSALFGVNPPGLFQVLIRCLALL